MQLSREELSAHMSEILGHFSAEDRQAVGNRGKD